ncbi:reprolysin-like metallopeptidase [Flavobacterium sp. N3904]|uniref:zinc-dependent metalloprotease n=1 Tax=Flavobacterium sp. N3904 TaxID=2986835 RepID=UPI0022255405|nr:zinc-dependent metalloprotease family protein [Flavobacterium sp. N3904]
MNRLLLFIGVFVFGFIGYSQEKNFWKEVGSSQISYSQRLENKSTDANQKLFFQLNEGEFKQSLNGLYGKSNIDKGVRISIPNNTGKIEQFVVVESSNFDPELQAQYPEIRAFSGIGITDPKASINFSISPNGIQTMVLRGDSGSEFIEHLADNKSLYVVLTSKSRDKGILPLTCKTEDVRMNKDLVKKTSLLKSNNGVFKTMRLALSCTGEYAQYFGGTVAGALAGMNATMSRVNGIFNKDLALKLIIIGNDTNIIYTNPVTDPYSDATQGVTTVSGCTGDCPDTWNEEVQSTITNKIGEGNYDIGQLFGASGGGGNASCIGCVCDPLSSTISKPVYSLGKGSGYTSPADSKPEGDTFDIDFVAHEMGHQLGANHSFSFEVEGTGVSVEPGSGSTIMGYAGITDYNVQSQSDDYFTYASILQIQDNLATKSCPISTALTNQTPTVNAGLDYTIPKNTAFVLKGAGSDPNGNKMTYCWEQYNSADSSQSDGNSIAYDTKPNGPNFRSVLPSSSSNRYMPALNKVLVGQLSSTWESVSSIARTMTFAFTARENAAIGLGQTNTDIMNVTVNATKGPFTITSQNATDASWVLGSSQTITWNVNGTTSLVGSANVNIKLSTDGGLTFPTVLAANTPNDGSEVVTAPMTAAKNCRILIEPTANIYYAVNSKPFALGYAIATSCSSYTFAAPFAIPESATFAEKTIVVPASSTEIVDVNVNVKFTHTYLGDVLIEMVSPTGTTVKLFDGSCGATDSSLTITYDDLGDALTCGETIQQTVAPAQLLSAFNGENPQGTWKLRVRDKGVGDTGTLDSASITICSSAYNTLATPSFDITDFVLYPNPNKGNFAIRFASPNTTDIQVLVNDMLGRKIYQRKYKNTGDFNENIQLVNAPVGAYIVTVIDGDRKGVSKIIVE